MAKQNQAAKTVSYAVGEIVEVSPNDCLIPEKAAERGRWQAPSVENVQDMALSLHTFGQMQDIEGYCLPGGKFRPVFGSTRIAAGQMLLAGFKDANNKEIKNTKFKLRIKIVASPSDDAAVKKNTLRNIEENLRRVDRNPMDDAQNIQTLIEDGMSMSEIGRKYNLDKSIISRFSALLKLPLEVQKSIADGVISKSAAIEMAHSKLEPIQCVTLLKTHGENLTGTVVREAARLNAPQVKPEDSKPEDSKPEDSKSEPEALATVQRSIGQLKHFLTDKARANDVTLPVKTICATILRYATGEISQAEADEQILNMDAILAELLEDENVMAAVADAKKNKK